jgi:hypothetical protein
MREVGQGAALVPRAAGNGVPAAVAAAWVPLELEAIVAQLLGSALARGRDGRRRM